MKAKLAFNIRSASSRIEEALKLAKKLNGEVIDKRMYVEVSDINTDFQKLMRLSWHFRNSELIVDDNPISDIQKFYDAVFCKKINRCSGRCTVDNNQWKFIFNPLGIYERPFQQSVFENTFHNQNYDMIEEMHIDHLVINRETVLNAYIFDFEMARKYCPKFNDFNNIDKIKSLPEKVKVNLTVNEPDEDEDEDSPVGIDLDKILAEQHKEQNEYTEHLINKVADEFETRLRKILDEYLKSISQLDQTKK